MRDMMLNNISKGLEYCLQSGKRLVDDGRLLQENKRYQSAIPLFILGYEELGKALFLIEKIQSKHQVHENEWRKLVASPKAHLKKVTMNYEEHIKTLLKISDEAFMAIQRKSEATFSNYTPSPSRQFAIMRTRLSLSAIKKLPLVKEACLYISYKDDKWLNLAAYSSGMMDDLCEVLYFENMNLYHQNMYKIEELKTGISGKKRPTEEQTRALENSQISRDIKEIYDISLAADMIIKRDHAYAVIENIASDYEHILKPFD